MGGFMIYIPAVPLAALGLKLVCSIKEKSTPFERGSQDDRPPRCLEPSEPWELSATETKMMRTQWASFTDPRKAHFFLNSGVLSMRT